MSAKNQVLLLGAGELGQAFLPHLSTLPDIHITLAVRTPGKYTHLTNSKLKVTSLDTTGASADLSKTFAEYDTVISCTGFGQPAGTVTKLAKEILKAGEIRKDAGQPKLWFFPWQWGVDYDITRDGGGLMPLFGEQHEVRELLRARSAESHVRWTIISTGIFMSFLFQPFWGIVDQQTQKIVVRALQSWDHKTTVTDVKDIGKVLARVIAGDVDSENKILYAAGDTVSYAQLADIIERLTEKEVEREEWTIPHLKAELEEEPDDLIRKYRLVFAGDGTWWNKERTVNHALGLPMTTVEDHAQEVLQKS